MRAIDKCVAFAASCSTMAREHEGRDDAPRSRTRARAFGLTYLAYASLYLERKGLSVAKVRLRDRVAIDASAIAAMETGYLLAYAVGQFGAGVLADRVGGRRVVACGLVGVAAACVLFGASTSTIAMFVAFMFNGLAQSSGWPGNNRVLEAWTTPSDRGTVMGFWSTCYQVGGIAGTALATWLLVHAGWRAVFFGPAPWLLAVGLAVFLFVPERERVHREIEAHRDSTPRDLAALLRNRTVWRFGASYFCVKLMRYSLLFWLPLYLHDALRFTEAGAGYVSTAFEIGGTAGTIVFGLVSDRIGRISRARLAGFGLGALALTFLVFANVTMHGRVAATAWIAAIGFLLFGPDALLSGAAAQELGGREAAARAVGIVNGIGSFGAVLQGTVTVGVTHAFGWRALFVVFVGLSVVAFGVLFTQREPRARSAS